MRKLCQTAIDLRNKAFAIKRAEGKTNDFYKASHAFGNHVASCAKCQGLAR